MAPGRLEQAECCHDAHDQIDQVRCYQSDQAGQRLRTAGDIKTPLEIFEEVKDGGNGEKRDLLFGWISDEDNRRALVLEENVDPALVAFIVDEGYAPDLTDQEIEQDGRDPFLMACALSAPADRWIMTTEVSAPKKQRQNRRIPDACAGLGISCYDKFHTLRALEFTKGWRC